MTYELLQKGIQEELISENKDIMDCLKIIAPSIYEARMKDPTIFSDTDDFERYLEMARDKSEFQRSSELQRILKL